MLERDDIDVDTGPVNKLIAWAAVVVFVLAVLFGSAADLWSW